MPVNDAQAYMDRYQDNFELWANEVLGMTISEDQRLIVNGLQDFGFVAAKSGTGTGKTAISAATALWFFTTHPESKTVLTAPTGHQLEDLLLAEIESWVRRIKIPFIRNAINIIKGKLYITGRRDWYIVGRTIPKDSKDKLGDVLAGFHAPYLLFIIDEASAVPDAVFAGIEGSMMQKNVKCLLVGNPTRANGYMFDCFNKNKEQWYQVTLSSLRSPFNNMDWIERMKNLHGETSDWFKTKCLGEFPSGAGLVVANYDQIREAADRHEAYDIADIQGMRVAGLDPSAGRNDSSVLTIRQGSYVWMPIRITHKDGPDLLPKVVRLCKAHGVREVYMDYNGIGVILYDLLRKDKTKSFKLYKVVSNARANDPEAYRNLRAELYKQLSDNFDELAIPYHDRFVNELPEISFLEDKTPCQVMDKPQIKSRLGFSPDYSDSLMLSTFRHFNFGQTSSFVYDTVAFEAMNTQLAYSSEFTKI